MPDSTTIVNQTPKEKPVVVTSTGNKKNMFKFSFVNPKILGAMTILLLLTGGIGAGVYLTQQPQQTTTQAVLPQGINITFKPEEIETDVNSEFSTDVFADARDNQIIGVDLGIKYDSQILTLKSITPGQFLPKVLVPPDIGSGTAFVSLGTDGNSGVSGSGIIASLKFKVNDGTQESSSQISFDPEATEIKVLNRTTESHTDSLGGAKVNIRPSGLKSSTPTFSPTPNPGSLSAETSNSTDFNNDGLTNAVDLSIMYSGWGTPETEVQKRADLNKDSVVNGIDYSILLPKFRL